MSAWRNVKTKWLRPTPPEARLYGGAGSNPAALNLLSVVLAYILKSEL